MSRPDPKQHLESQRNDSECKVLNRRDFLAKALPHSLAVLALIQLGQTAAGEEQEAQSAKTPTAEGKRDQQPTEEAKKAEPSGYKASEHKYAMGINLDKCIGCGRCVEACKTENDVPREPFYFRTWIERYVVQSNRETVVTSPNGGIQGFPPVKESEILRTFFVPKLCNQCANPPCVQVCPVGATFLTQDGVVLVDQEYCIGCRYCIQGCPYGARFMNPVTRTADKCTFCYHRLVKGLVPACVEVCPTQARIFGELDLRSSPLARFTRLNKVQTLKAHLNTEPRVFYANVDGEVR